MASSQVNLAKKLDESLPAELVSFLRQAGGMSLQRGQGLYLVGGAVRDLLLGQASLDLDVVVEGDAIALAKSLAGQSKIVTHAQFGTATIRLKSWSIDFATTRSETYSHPGALPTVKPGSIREDLCRRDFTINAMAICLVSHRYGELLDLYGGEQDLKDKLIRILHDKSFMDDATRIWRALRYEQRLDFQLESRTLQLLKRDIPMLETISADRLRYDLECTLRERYPEKVLRRAAELNVLSTLHPTLTGNGWLADKFEHARRTSSSDLPLQGLYLSLLTYRLNKEQTEDFILRLNLPRALARIVRDTSKLKDKLDSLAEPDIAPSKIYSLLQGCSPVAMTAVSIATELPIVKERIHLFLDKQRYIKPILTGEDLKQMGISGPQIGHILRRLNDAKLEGKAISRQDEEKLAKEIIRQSGNGGLKR